MVANDIEIFVTMKRTKKREYDGEQYNNISMFSKILDIFPSKCLDSAYSKSIKNESKGLIFQLLCLIYTI